MGASEDYPYSSAVSKIAVYLLKDRCARMQVPRFRLQEDWVLQSASAGE